MSQEQVLIYNILQHAREERKKQCKASFYEFVKLMWSTVCNEPFQFNWHIKYLANELQAVGERVIRREEASYDLIINISPGETKSILVSQMFNAWLWTHDESIRFLGSSHTHSLSEFNSMMCQEIILSDTFIKVFGHIRLKDNMKGKGDFMTLKNGRRKTTSVGTKITGSHFHIIAFDDLVDAEKELSFKEIEDAKNHMTKCWSRKVDFKVTVFILVMQRVTTNDPTPFFKTLSMRPVKHIRLPAEDSYLVSPPSLRQFYKDGLMNPVRKPRTELDKLKSKGITKYNAEYGQTPDDLKGKTAKREYFIIKKKKDFPVNFFATNTRLIADTAYTEKKKNDPSGFLLVKYINNILYLIDFFEEWLEHPDAVERIASLMSLYGSDAAHIENKASGYSIAQSIRKVKAINAIDYEQTSSDKLARLIDALPMLQAHRVVVVLDDNDLEQLARMEYFISTVTQFPDNSVRDESVDTLVMAIKLSGNDFERQWN